MSIHPSALIALFLCFFSVSVIMHYEQRMEVIEVTTKLETKHSNQLNSYHRCLNTAIDMIDVKGCISVYTK